MPNLSEENMENMRDFYANFGKSQQMGLPDQPHDPTKGAPSAGMGSV